MNTTAGPLTQTSRAAAPGLALGKLSLGMGDRFAHQGKAQLRACMMAAEHGVEVIPVWNKSNREHGVVGSEPSSVRAAADAAVHDLGWKAPYHVDADHINLTTVDRFLGASDFYTLYVASSIGNPAAPDRKQPYREVTIIYHEVGVVASQAFPVFNDLSATLAPAADFFAINYETGAIEAEVSAD